MLLLSFLIGQTVNLPEPLIGFSLLHIKTHEYAFDSSDVPNQDSFIASSRGEFELLLRRPLQRQDGTFMAFEHVTGRTALQVYELDSG